MLPLNVIAAAGSPVSLVGATIIDISADPDNAEAGYRLLATGEEQTRDGLGASWVTIGTWLTAGSAADYEVQWTATGATPTGTAINSWVGLGSGASWINLTDAEENLLTSGTMAIRRASGGSALTSASVSLRAERAI